MHLCNIFLKYYIRNAFLMQYLWSMMGNSKDKFVKHKRDTLKI